MKRMPFEPLTDHYDARIEAIDEKICKLIMQRKELSNNNPGFPVKELIANWAIKYDFPEDFLNSVFAHFLNEELYHPVVEPKGFLKIIPILKSFEKDGVFYSVTFISQYENSSVVHFTIDREESEGMRARLRQDHTLFHLSIEGVETEYDCRSEGGGGSGGHESYTFIVSPALPEDISEYKLVFKEYKPPFQKLTGFEFII